MKVLEACVIEIIEQNGFDYLYVDNHVDGVRVYYFEHNIIRFESSCVSNIIAKFYLRKFQLENQISELQKKDCRCDW